MVSTITRTGRSPARGPLGQEDLPGRLDAVHLRHPDVHQHDVGGELVDQPDRLDAVAGRADDLHARPGRRRSPGRPRGRAPGRRRAAPGSVRSARSLLTGHPRGRGEGRPPASSRRRTSSRPPTDSSRRACRRGPGPPSGRCATGAPAIGWVSPAVAASWSGTAFCTSIRRSPSQCRSTRTGRSRRPCLIALVSISWSTRNATTSSSGGSGCGVPTTVDVDLVPAGAHALDQVVEVVLPGRDRCGRTGGRGEHLPHVLQRGAGRGRDVGHGLLERVRCRRPSRYCADSAWARITASEWPTTSCTSRASRACSSRSRAISSAWSRSRLGLRPGSAWEASDRAENRSASPSSQGAISSAVPRIAAGSRQLSCRRTRVGRAPGRRHCRARRRARRVERAATATRPRAGSRRR